MNQLFLSKLLNWTLLPTSSYRNNSKFRSKCKHLMRNVAAREFNHFDYRPSQFFLHPGGRLYRHSQFKHLLYFSSFNVQDSIKDLRNETKFNLANEPLNRFKCRVCVCNAKQTNTRKTNIGKYLEITCPSNLIKDYEIRSYKEYDLCCFL